MKKKLKPGSVSVVMTSPPYNVGAKYAHYEDNLPEEDYLNWLAEVFQSRVPSPVVVPFSPRIPSSNRPRAKLVAAT